MNLVYRFQSEEMPSRSLRLKIEINSREHFTELGYVRRQFDLPSRWMDRGAEVTTFALEELLGTKLRALYQRRKGRDLFDLGYALERGADPDPIVACFQRYMREGGHSVTKRSFSENLANKLEDNLFREDLSVLLGPEIEWSMERAASLVQEQLIARLTNERRKT